MKNVDKDNSEFYIAPFVKYYEEITDSFIDVKSVAESLKRYIPTNAQIFEVGLGTGYFASMFAHDGYRVKGIQPPDEMLSVLKQKSSNIEIVAECKLENYTFSEQYETIVSHSSVFLFTRHETPFGLNKEVLHSYMFQSFIREKTELLRNLHKTLMALLPNGSLYINIQSNPLSFVQFDRDGEQITFEMNCCDYFLELNRVEKTFTLTYSGESYEVHDHRFCETYTAFADQVFQYGFKTSISEDQNWVIVNRP